MIYFQTPLHRCASKGNTAIVELLLSRKDIQLNPQDREGNTPLYRYLKLMTVCIYCRFSYISHLSCEEERQTEAKMLIKAGALTDIQNKVEFNFE